MLPPITRVFGFGAYAASAGATGGCRDRCTSATDGAHANGAVLGCIVCWLGAIAGTGAIATATGCAEELAASLDAETAGCA